MKIIFAGTPNVSATILKRLLESGHEIIAVLTQPDRPSGRGHKLLPGPVKVLANQHHIAVHQPHTLRDSTIQDTLRAYQADLMIVVAYGLIVPKIVLDIPRLGCWNIHFSLLPRWRGASPVQRAIEAGDVTTGVAIMQMDKGLDTGPILIQKAFPLNDSVTSGELLDVLAIEGGTLVLEALNQQEAGTFQPHPQAEEGVTYAHKITKEEAQIDWAESAEVIARKVRAFHPWPMAYAVFNGEVLKIGAAKAIPSFNTKGKAIGEVAYLNAGSVAITTGEGALELLAIQRPGSKMLPIAMFLNGQTRFFKGRHSQQGLL